MTRGRRPHPQRRTPPTFPSLDLFASFHTWQARPAATSGLEIGSIAAADRIDLSESTERGNVAAGRQRVRRPATFERVPTSGRFGPLPGSSAAGSPPEAAFPAPRRSLPPDRPAFRRRPQPGSGGRRPIPQLLRPRLPATSAPPSPTRAPTRRSASAPRPWPNWTGPRPPSSATSATSSARRSR